MITIGHDRSSNLRRRRSGRKNNDEEIEKMKKRGGGDEDGGGDNDADDESTTQQQSSRIQFFRPRNAPYDQIQEMLEDENMTTDDIQHFVLTGETKREKQEQSESETTTTMTTQQQQERLYREQVNAFRQRRIEIRNGIGGEQQEEQRPQRQQNDQQQDDDEAARARAAEAVQGLRPPNVQLQQQQQQQQPPPPNPAVPPAQAQAAGGNGAGAGGGGFFAAVVGGAGVMGDDDMDMIDEQNERAWLNQQEEMARNVIRQAVLRYQQEEDAGGDINIVEDLILINPNFNQNQEQQEQQGQQQQQRNNARRHQHQQQQQQQPNPHRQRQLDVQQHVLQQIAHHHDHINHNGPNGGNHNHFTFRRICIALLAVITAFVCIMIQTFPVVSSSENYQTIREKENHLIKQILNWKQLSEHSVHCPNLDRSSSRRHHGHHWSHYHSAIIYIHQVSRQLFSILLSVLSWSAQNSTTKTVSTMAAMTVDCSDGVLHIPSSTAKEGGPFDKIWYIPCEPVKIPPSIQEYNNSPSSSSSCYPGYSNNRTHPPQLLNDQRVATPADNDSAAADDVCVDREASGTLRGNNGDNSNNQNLCFRGIHDNFINEREINDILRMGSSLISMGGDHFDIHENAPLLQSSIPSVLNKLEALLKERYKLPTKLQPIAFRVHASAPMDGENVPIYGLDSTSHPLVRLLNRTNYLQYMEKSLRHNQHVAKYYYTSLPWPFRMPLSSSKRDTCNLMADMEADDSFHVLTSIFLSDGGGAGVTPSGSNNNHDYRGGLTLYVDDDDYDSNNNKKKKIRRGLTIEGSRGRLVVSTGGLENKRCRLPIRAGIRATLQIWWGC